MSRKEATDETQELNPKFNCKQAFNQMDWNFVTADFFAGKIEKRVLKVQTTTTDRLAITQESQLRWFFYRFFYYMRKNNTGVCNKTGKVFEKLFDHFVLSLDEAYIMADASGNINFLGSADRKKHENIISDRLVHRSPHTFIIRAYFNAGTHIISSMCIWRRG